LFKFSSLSRRDTAVRVRQTPRSAGDTEGWMLHLKLGPGRVAIVCAVAALAPGCTPDHVAKNAAALTEAARARAAAPPPRLAAAPGTPPPAGAQLAEQQNAERPFAGAPIEAMRPFVLKADAADRARAVQCLTQAVYYEAAREPLKGQEAVAQVVLNRVRHPAYPKSVCGVVYQGAAKATGCQFTFTCDGSLRWRPQPALWARAEDVARRALAGFVDADVGSATHYHAVYVAPYWAPTLTKMTQVGQQIFYRWPGGWGEPGAFVGRYAGHEAQLTPAVLRSGDARTPEGAPPAPALREVTLTVGGGVARAYKVADAAAPGGARTRMAGVLQPSRRRATPEEIQRINDGVAQAAKRLEAQTAPAGGIG
jgi:spore germination cell wall hydrolase CwlJ-like protein